MPHMLLFLLLPLTSTAYQPTSPQPPRQTLVSAYKVYIDGSAGTTGLQVRDRLSSRKDIELIGPPEDKRKEDAARRACLKDADAAILCLPDAASEQVAKWCTEDNLSTILIDASTAFRVAEDWTYGFPELNADQRELGFLR